MESTSALGLPVALTVLALGSGCGGGVLLLPDPGAEAYAEYCALCHGAEGEGYEAEAANALANPQFLSVASDMFLQWAIVRGRPGTSMSGWADTRGGPLDTEEIDAVVAWIRVWQTAPSVDVSQVRVHGVAERGEPLYEFLCAECHGDVGQGGSHMSLNNPAFLASASDGFIRHAIAEGRRGTRMPGYKADLTAQGIDDLVVLIRSWQIPLEDDPSELPSTDLGDVVINPDGPEPGFDREGRFVGADEVEAELERGAALVILDARPPGDYVRGHISGAVSVPFYAVEDYLDQLSKEHWIVAYCACPHAESGHAVDVLARNGYSLLKVLDEGVLVWEERGYPMTSGPKP